MSDFDIKDAKIIKKFEKTTKHDVKAVEYYLKSKFDKSNHLKKYKEYIHICCTSEDINNLSYALMVEDGRKIILAKINDLNKILKSNIKKFSKNIMLSHTHGQPATPTTMGKEFLNFHSRIERLSNKLAKHPELIHLSKLDCMLKSIGTKSKARDKHLSSSLKYS